MDLLKNAKFSRLECSNADGDTTIDTMAVDMAGFDSVMFVVLLGSTVDEGVVLTLLADDSSDNSDFTETEATVSATGAAAAADIEKLMILNINKPLNRYVRASLEFTTQTAEVDGIMAIQYNANDGPITQPTATYSDGTTAAGVIGSATFASPGAASS